MAFDFQRALTLGRTALRLVEQVRSMSGAGTTRGAAPSSPASRAGRRRRADAEETRGARSGGAGSDHALLPDFTGRARVEYAPVPGATPDPGEVVWTWVPFEEMDGRGKDRPVLLVGRDGDLLLALMLTSKDHTIAARRDADYVDVGTGPWDRGGRASEAKLDRILRVDPAAVRREGGVLERSRFDAVAEALARAQGWDR